VPSGKLTFSWEKRWQDCAAYGNYPTDENHGKNDYAEGVFLGYRWFDSRSITPLFPFGFGLSYTTFAYSNLQIQTAADGSLSATFSVENTGTLAGDEVSQLYVSPPSCPTPRPVHELKGFARTSLKPGETKSVTIPIPHDDLAYWNPETKQWIVTPGTYTAQVGASSRELPLHAAFHE
jgi:beta-glucosidase